MHTLDLASLGLLTLGNFIAMAVALPLVMGAHISPAARHVQHYFMLQAATWTSMVLLSRLRGSVWEPALAIGATMTIMLGQWTLSRALVLWLGPRPGLRWLRLCCLAGPLGFALLWPHGLGRFLWFSFFQGLGLLILAHMCLRPQKECARGWRWVLCGCGLVIALALWTRTARAWLGTEPLHYTSPDALNHVFIILCGMCTTALFAAVLAAWRDETNQQLRTLVVTDELTGLLNRRGFEERARAMLAHSRRLGLPLTAVMVDLDHFKRINDALGHEAGDQVLRLFGRLLQAQRRESDLAARLGGEEFCLLLYGDAAAGRALDARLRSALRAGALSELGHAIDYSAGLAERQVDEQDLTALLARADAALYTAKASGRGQLQGHAHALIATESIAASA